MQMRKALWPLLVLGAMGAGLASKTLGRQKNRRRAVYKDAGEPDRDYGQVRPAGAESQRTPTEDWDKVDEAADESFPASDPPSHSTPTRPGH